MKRTHSWLILTLTLLTLTAACVASIETVPDDPEEDPDPPVVENPMTTAETFAAAQVNQGVFSLGSDFPPDIQIPAGDELGSTAFVVTFLPSGVIPLDLDAAPVGLSPKFPIFDASSIPEAAFPNNVLILNKTEGLLMGTASGNEGIVYFNPSTGATLDTLSLADPIQLSEALPYSLPSADCGASAGPGAFIPSLPADMAVVADRLFVALSNGCFDSGFESFYLQSILLVFEKNDSPPYFTPAATPYIVLSGFNASGISVVDGMLIVTSTGDTTFSSGSSAPQTPSFLTEVDPNSLEVARSLNLGMVAANFQPLAVTGDGARAFIGSSSFSEVYEINLNSFSVIRGKDNPLVLFDSPEDFLTDQKIAFGDQILFVSSFNNSGVKAVDLSETQPEVLPQLLNFAFEGNPGVTGVGPMALRPGQPGVAFNGPDLWVLTASPGTVSNARTY